METMKKIALGLVGAAGIAGLAFGAKKFIGKDEEFEEEISEEVEMEEIPEEAEEV